MKARWAQLRELLRSLWRLRPHVRAGRWLILAIVSTAILAAALEMATLGLLAPLIRLILGLDDLPSGRFLGFLPRLLPDLSRTQYLLVFAGGVVLATLGKNLVLYLSSRLGARLRTRVTVNLRHSMYQRLQEAPLTVFEQHPAGEVASVFLNDSIRIMWMTDNIVLLLQRASLLLAYLGILTAISGQLMLWTLVLAAVIGVVIAGTMRRAKRLGTDVADHNRRLSGMLVEGFAGVRVVRTAHAQQHAVDRFRAACEDTGRAEETFLRNQARLMPIAETLGVAGALALLAGATLWLVGPGALKPEALAVFAFALLRLLPVLSQVYQIQTSVLFYAGSVKEVERWLSLPRYPARPFGDVAFTDLQQGIRFEDVALTYDTGRQALRGVRFELPAGRTVALVGASGSGKTTVATLLLRLRTPTGGRILVDGRDYWDFGAASWHRAVAIVEQEAFLFHDTLARNVAFGRPDATREDIERALRMANLMDVVRALPQGLDTVVGERGATLSGGQRQRLAIARALVRDPQILILDEATSALDSVSERLVQAALEAATRGRTTLVIAHRLSTVRNADRIVVLHEGEVAEQGTWDELMARGGAFAELARGSLAAG